MGTERCETCRVDEPKQGLGCIEYRKSGVEDQKKKIQIKKQLKHWDLKKNIAYFI
jgi:hypothetical protein